MRPLSFVNGVVFGSTDALAGVCGVILFLRYVLTLDASLDQSVVRSALPLAELAGCELIFSLLAVLAGWAFWGQVTGRRWRWLAEVALASALVAALMWFLSAGSDRARGLVLLVLCAVTILAVGTAAWYAGWWSRCRHRL